MTTAYRDDLLRGRCQNLPDVRSKVVRVFISSTFSDTLAERDSLIENVFPKLKDSCRQKYGLEFQYADMRWGIQNESSDNHSEVQTCLHEIDLCQKYSLATNFVVLLSHRYGSRPTPATIRATVFDQLLAVLRANESHRADVELICRWYQLDSNPSPPVYVLRPISSMIPNILSSDTTEMKAAAREWKRINRQIHHCLRTAAVQLHEQEKISADEYDDFFISVTEKEIVKGILDAPNANQRALCFFREIEDIDDHLSDGKASKYIDMKSTSTGESVIDSEAETLLNRLKNVRIPKKLQSKNIFSYRVRWKPDGINRRDHADYISQFNEDFHRAIQEQIDHCIRSNPMVVSDPVQHEVLEHAIQCKTYLSKFHGRIDVMDKLEQFIHNAKEKRPCVVYGASGCGKTSVLAKAASEVLKWWSDRSVSVILRFLGTTPASSTIYKTLLSISQHICQLYDLSMQNYSEVQQLRHQLETQLFLQIPANEYLVIILDSIDQLESDAYDCQWLPRVFPKNIKCILSTLPDHGHILVSLKSLINLTSSLTEETDHLFVFVPPFEPGTVEIVYNDWLKAKNRSLTDVQRTFLRTLMEKQTQILPLYMKLVFDIISTWHSYDSIDEAVQKLTTIDQCIRYLFNQLKKVHSSVLFSRAICYMTACRNGISQNELEDVLSLDDDVLKSVFQHYIPPLRRLPGILWTRIRNDLEEYITEKEADDSSVIYWYHRRFIEVASADYISKLNTQERTAVFQNMVDFYKETWKGKNKPFKIDNPNLMHKYNLSESEGQIEGNRLIASQPIDFVDMNGQIQFNRRKLNELPQFITQLTSNLAIPIFAEEITFNYRFMYAKLRCSSFNEISDLFSKCDQSSSYQLSQEVQETQREMKIFKLIYLIIGILLEQHPDNYPFEVTARALNLYGIKSQMTRLIKQFDEEAIHHWALVVPYAQLPPPGSGLLFSMRYHTTSVVEIDFTEDQQIAISLSDRIIVFDMGQLLLQLNINLPPLQEPYLNSTTIPDINQHGSEQSTTDDSSRFKRYSFLVNSQHQVYLISAQEKIKFERTSTNGFAIVAMLDMDRALCVIAECESHSIDCWDLRHNRLVDRIQFPSSSSPIQSVKCVADYHLIITKLQDGSLHCHSIADGDEPTFIHRAAMKGDPHLDLIVPLGHFLLCTYDPSSAVRLALIDLQPFNQAEETLVDQDILKTLLGFDPPIASKPIERIILPNELSTEKKEVSNSFPVFIVKTVETLYCVHKCKNATLSYIAIHGQYDVVHLHPKDDKYVYACRGSTIEVHKLACLDNKAIDQMTRSSCVHKHQLYVSIETSAAPITAIHPQQSSGSLFLCATQDGAIQAYVSTHARAALKNIPPLPRANQAPKVIQLLRSTAVTLDAAKRELIAWTYQHSSVIQSRRHDRDSLSISDFVTAPSKTDPTAIFILILTTNHYVEIYTNTSLDKEPIYAMYLRSPARVHATKDGTFLLVTNKGALQSIAQQTQHQDHAEFFMKSNAQLKIPTASMFSTVVSLNDVEHLVILADNGLSMAIWNSEQVIYLDMPTSPSSLSVKSIDGHSIDDLLVLYLNDQTLLSSRIQFNPPTIQMDSWGQVAKFAFKNDCMATVTDEKQQLSLWEIHSHASSQQIQLEGRCEHLCLNESATHVFTVVQPQTLWMHRVSDGQPLAKLFLFDFTLGIMADHDFIVLAMNDRRLLTLMIADPKDPSVQDKIQALPSRNPQRMNGSVANSLVEHIDKHAEVSSSEEESDDEEEGKNSSTDATSIEMTVPATGFLRFVTRFTSRHSPAKMSKEPEKFAAMDKIFTQHPEKAFINGLIDDSDVEDHEESAHAISKTISELPISDDLQEIHRKVLQQEQEQIKGIQLANAGHGNLKVVNNYSVTSKTCAIL